MPVVCPQCGHENLTRSSFCETCLHEFPSDLWETKRLICPECRYDNPYSHNYCERCHEPLKPGQAE